MIREDVYAAAFAFFSGLVSQDQALFKLSTRKMSTWEGVSPDDQPALLMRQKHEHALRRKGFPTVWTFNIELLLYVHTGASNDAEIVPAEVLNPLLDAIEASVAVDDNSNYACTLGGLVSHCAINGDVVIFTGDLGDEAVAIVPIEILVNG